MNKYKLQTTSLWRFPDRGNWSTHKGDYRGNWSPHIPRNLILRYTKENDTVLDPFVGSGTTLIECRLLNRNAIGIDVNPKALSIANHRIDFSINNSSSQKTYVGNALNLNKIEDCSIDFICTHPPYADIIKYSDNIENDLSLLDYNDFIEKIKIMSDEFYRILNHDNYCCIMIGDIRKQGLIIPLGLYTLNALIDSGFTLKEVIIKEQFNCLSTKKWKNISRANFLLLAHEYLFVVRK